MHASRTVVRRRTEIPQNLREIGLAWFSGVRLRTETKSFRAQFLQIWLTMRRRIPIRRRLLISMLSVVLTLLFCVVIDITELGLFVALLFRSNNLGFCMQSLPEDSFYAFFPNSTSDQMTLMVCRICCESLARSAELRTLIIAEEHHYCPSGRTFFDLADKLRRARSSKHSSRLV